MFTPTMLFAACKTEKGFSLLLIERSEGLTTKAIKTSYSPAAGTAYVLYEDVKACAFEAPVASAMPDLLDYFYVLFFMSGSSKQPAG